MSEVIRDIQLKRTDKPYTDSSIKNTVLKDGEPLVSSNGYSKIGNGKDSLTALPVYIAKKGIPKPYLVQTEYTFCNAAITPVWVSSYSEYYTLSGSLTATKTGIYTCKVSLNKNNNGIIPCTWEDGTTSDFTVTWKINATMPVKADEAVIADTAKQLVNPIKVDGVNGSGTNVVISHFGVCSTASSNVAKTVTIPGFVLENGSYVAIRFNQAQPAVSNTNITLNISGTGAKNVYTVDGSAPCWKAGQTLLLYYYSNSYQVVSSQQATTDVPGIVLLDNTIGSTSKTNAATPYLVNQKSECKVQTATPSSNLKAGDLWVNPDTGVMKYWYNNKWNDVHNTWA